MVVACTPESLEPTWPEAFGYLAPEVHGIEIGARGFPYIPVEIDGKRLELLLDTGNMVGISLSSASFDRLGLSADRSYERLSSAGKPSGRLRVAEAVDAVVLGHDLGPVPVYELDDSTLPGLVGPDSLPVGHFTLDYASRKMGSSQRRLPDAAPGFRRLDLQRSSRHPRLVLVRGEVEGREVLIELDTGKSRTVIHPELASRLGLARNRHGVVIESLRLGDLELAVKSAKEVDQTGIETGLPEPILLGLGSDVLSRFVWTVDYDGGALWIPVSAHYLSRARSHALQPPSISSRPWPRAISQVPAVSFVSAGRPSSS